MKRALIISDQEISNIVFQLIDYASNAVVFNGMTKEVDIKSNNAKFIYELNFTSFNRNGRYVLYVKGNRSYPFLIGENIYSGVVDSLMLFFKVQRCGYTYPLLHAPCHLSDVARLEGADSSHPVDVTGGWHDAGDYIKFLTTSAYTTYMLMFSYEFDRQKFGFDNDKNNVPDILEEAKIGLDWLLRCNYQKDKLITQVQDLRDHQIGWRMPEDDSLQYDRVGFVSIGKNQIGLYTAVMALAARIWKQKFYDSSFAAKCLDAAKNIYALKKNAPDIDSSFTGMYKDMKFYGKLALGAVELYQTLGDKKYLKEAFMFADSANSDYWWSYGDINSLAHFKLAKYEPRYKNYIYHNLEHFNEYRRTTMFEEGADFSWGSTNLLMGIALQSILWKNLTNEHSYDSLATSQRDYILGKNPWGVSFIYNIGTVYPKNIHHQVAYFNGGYLPGALVAGPAPLSILKQYEIKRENSAYDQFNSDSVKYYDDRWDFITNEPTIISNATALFVFGYLSNRK